MAETSEFLLVIMVILAMASGRQVTNSRAGIAQAWAEAKFDVGLTPPAVGGKKNLTFTMEALRAINYIVGPAT
jgi:hypothetical protein